MVCLQIAQIYVHLEFFLKLNYLVCFALIWVKFSLINISEFKNKGLIELFVFNTKLPDTAKEGILQ